MGVDLGGWSFGAQFGDLNNDGTLDLYLVNGYVSASQERELLVRLLEGRRRPRGRHLRREELAADGRRAASPATRRRRSGSTTAPASFVDVAPMVGVTDRYDGRVGRARRLRQPRRARRRRRQPARTAAALPQRRGAGPRLDRLRPDRPLRLGQRAGQTCSNRSAIGAQVTRPLERPAAGAGGLGRLRLLRPEPAAPPLRPGRDGRRSRRSSSAGLPVRSARSRPRRRAACTPSRSRDDRAARVAAGIVRQALPRARPRHDASSSSASSRSASSRAGRGRRSRSSRRSPSSWCSAGCSAASGRTWPAPTSRASASACWCARRSSGRTRCAPRSRSPRST